MLVAKTCRQLVVTGEEGEVIGNVRNLVLHTVVVGEQLVTGAHIRFQNLVSVLVLACHDVDKRERRRVGAAHVLYIGVGEQIDDLQKFDSDTFVNALFDVDNGSDED